MKRTASLCLGILLLLGAVATAQNKEHATPAELSAQLPVLEEFHEVIYPLWHQAWPNKDYALIRELLPKVVTFTAQIEATPLPGILRDREEKWKQGVATLRTCTDKLSAAVKGGQEQAMLDAVEKLHSSYEGLVRTVRPRFAEMEAYHAVLYQIYHYYMPNKDLAKLRTASKELIAKSAALVKAQTPKRFVEKEAQFRAVLAKIDATTQLLARAAKGKKWPPIEKAVEEVHNSYLELEQLYE
jgi:hypothetical protein